MTTLSTPRPGGGRCAVSAQQPNVPAYALALDRHAQNLELPETALAASGCLKLTRFHGHLILMMEVEHGGLCIQYAQQKPDGTLLAPLLGGWGRVHNLASLDTTKPII